MPSTRLWGVRGPAMETRAPTLWLGKGGLCLRLRAPGNDNQELSFSNHHSNIKT